MAYETSKSLGLEPQDKTTINWRRITRHPALMEYRRLAVIIYAINLAFAWYLAHNLDFNSLHSLVVLANAAIINFTIGILIRQQRVVNALFWLATRIPTSAPLWIRWGAGKVFHFGGIHSSANISGTFWFIALSIALYRAGTLNIAKVSPLTMGISVAIIVLLTAMCLTAYGPIRQRFHNLFERVHRFAGWTVLGLFWIQTVSAQMDAGQPLTQSLGFWLLIPITISVISPWLTLKKVDVEVEKLSNHAIAMKFDYGDTPFAGSSNSISLKPLMEWHAFANVPTPGEDGYRLVISRAGDWTGNVIDNPPDKVWVKGITTSGVARIEELFSKVVYVGTGSGIGPILPHLFKNTTPSHVVWSTRNPRATYGDAFVDKILAARPDALVWDTTEKGKPDLSKLAYEAVQRTGAEAVIVISNEKLTRKVVHDMESLGIPAYGAIWDS